MQDGFFPSWHNLSHLERNLTSGIASMRQVCGHVCGAFFWLVIDLKGPNSPRVMPPWEVDPELHKKASWASYKRWASKQLCSMVSASVAVFGFQVPALTSLDDALWCGSITNKPFLSPKLVLGQFFITANQNTDQRQKLTHRLCLWKSWDMPRFRSSINLP